MPTPRDRLVERARRLVETVAYTAADDATIASAEARLAAVELELRERRLSSVLRTSFEDAVGSSHYVWQWANPGLPEVQMAFG